MVVFDGANREYVAAVRTPLHPGSAIGSSTDAIRVDAAGLSAYESARPVHGNHRSMSSWSVLRCSPSPNPPSRRVQVGGGDTHEDPADPFDHCSRRRDHGSRRHHDVLPPAGGTIRSLPNLNILEVWNTGFPLQSTCFNTTGENLEWRRGKDIQSAAITVTESKGAATATPVPPDVHELSYHPADLVVDTADYDRPAILIGTRADPAADHRAGRGIFELTRYLPGRSMPWRRAEAGRLSGSKRIRPTREFAR